MQKLRIAAFGGFRGIPPKAGAAGSDKFAFELYPRIVKRGHNLVAYCRIYPGDNNEQPGEYDGIKLKYFKTVHKAGFDTLVHSAKATFDVIFKNTADVVHLHSGANSIARWMNHTDLSADTSPPREFTRLRTCPRKGRAISWLRRCEIGEIRKEGDVVRGRERRVGRENAANHDGLL